MKLCNIFFFFFKFYSYSTMNEIYYSSLNKKPFKEKKKKFNIKQQNNLLNVNYVQFNLLI